MARVISHTNTSESTTAPFMDRLSHAVIKETSKNLRHYLDVKRRENAFIVGPSSTSSDSIPLKARFMYGTAKEYPPLYGSYHSDNDIKPYLQSFSPQNKQSYMLGSNPEKQLCRDELDFHMRIYKSTSRENVKFSELRLRPPVRSNSSCSGNEVQNRRIKTVFKRPHNEQNQLVDNAANILASMVRTRKSIYEKYLLSQQIPPTYNSRNANPSPRQPDEQSNVKRTTVTSPLRKLSLESRPSNCGTESRPTTAAIEQTKKSKRKTVNPLAKSTSIMHHAKQITTGIQCDYKIFVTTGNRNGASTNAPIRIKLYGTMGCTDFIDLIQSEDYRVPFLKGQTDKFTVTAYHVGRLVGITIGHEQTEIRASWFLSKVLVHDPIRDINYDIPCNSWLSSKSNDQKTMRDFEIPLALSDEKNVGDGNEYRDGNRSPSGSSAASGHAITSNNDQSNNQNDRSSTRKRSRKHRKQKTSDSTFKDRKSSVFHTDSVDRSSDKTSTKLNLDHVDYPSPTIHTGRTPSPCICRTPPIIVDSEDDHADRTTRSKTSTSPTRDIARKQPVSSRNTSQRMNTKRSDSSENDSVDRHRPSARFEQHSPLLSVSREPPKPSKKQTSEDDLDEFFS